MKVRELASKCENLIFEIAVCVSGVYRRYPDLLELESDNNVSEKLVDSFTLEGETLYIEAEY